MKMLGILVLVLTMVGCGPTSKGAGDTHVSPKNCSSAYPSGVTPGQPGQLSIRFEVSALGGQFKNDELAHRAMPQDFTERLTELAVGTGKSFAVADGTASNLTFEIQVFKDETEHYGVNIIVWGPEHLGETGSSETVALFVVYLEERYVSEEAMLSDAADIIAQRLLHGWTC